MVKEQVIGSYIIRFAKSIMRHETAITITLQDIKTGEQLEFETWLAAWAFLEDVLDDEIGNNRRVFKTDSKSIMVEGKQLTELSIVNEYDLEGVDKSSRKPSVSGGFTKMALSFR